MGSSAACSSRTASKRRADATTKVSVRESVNICCTAVVDLVALEADGDGRPDLAVALTTASGGRLRVFLNRSVAPG
jgi:hypothetical protein